MADPTINDFQGRIKKIEKNHRKGRGFEANGTVGKSFYTRAKRKKLPVFRTMLVMLLFAFCFKAVLLTQIGTEGYLARLDQLRAGNPVENIGAKLMALDPVTELIAAGIAMIIG